MRRLVALIVAACAAMAGCGGGSSADEAPRSVVTTAVPPNVEGSATAMTWPTGRHLVRTQEQWVSLWSTNEGRLNLDCIYNPTYPCKGLPAYAMPEFDFAQYSLLVVFDRLYGGQSLGWGKVEVSGGVLNVEVLRKSVTNRPLGSSTLQQGVIFLLVPATSLQRFASPHRRCGPQSPRALLNGTLPFI